MTTKPQVTTKFSFSKPGFLSQYGCRSGAARLGAVRPGAARSAGFTLIELLITIVIIGVLSVIGLNNFVATQMKARDAQRKSDLETLAKSLEMYYNDKGRYPTVTGGEILGIDWGDDGGFTDTTVTGGAIYLSKMPQDPGEFSYYYTIGTNGVSFVLYARLENTKDRAVGTYTGTDCGETECNYALSSTNVQP